MTILKFLSGGTPMFLPITDPFRAPQGASLQAASSSKKDSGLISDDLMKKLYENGIPTDVDNFLDKVADLEQELSLGFPVSSGAIRKLEALGNRIVQQSKYLKNAEEAAAKNDALGEIAVGSRGELFVADLERGVKKVSLGEFDPEKMAALTVGEIIEARKFSPSLAFNEDIIPVAGRNIGLSKINEQIMNIIKTVGTTSSTSEAYTDLAGYIGREAAKKPSLTLLEQLQGLYDVMQKVGPDAIFKNKLVMSSKNMEEALNYIESVLPVDVKRQLIGRHVAAGNSYESSPQYMRGLIAQALGASNDYKLENYIDYDASMNKAGGTKAGTSGSSKTFYQTPNEALFDGDLNQTTITLTDNAFGNQTGVQLKGTTAAALTTDKGEAVSNLPMGVALNATVGKYLLKDKMYMGDQKITEGALNDIAYASDQVAVVNVPVDSRHNIDWEAFHGFSAAEKEIRERNIIAPEDKNKVHAKYRSYAHYNENNELVPETITERYFLTYGYTIDDKIADSNKMVEELTGDAEDQMDRLLDQIYSKPMRKKYGIDGISQKQKWDDIFKVPIFIKVNDFASQDAYRYGGHGSNMTPQTLQQDMLQLLTAAASLPSMYGSSDLLYQQ